MDTDTIKVEIPVSRKDLKLLAPAGQKVASREQVRDHVLRLFQNDLVDRRGFKKGGAA
jgi:hypothetical protein